MKRLVTTLGLLGALVITPSTAQSIFDSNKFKIELESNGFEQNSNDSEQISQNNKKSNKAPANQNQPQQATPTFGPKNPNIREIVSNKESMFQISKDKDNWFFTLSDSLVGRLILAVTRYTTTPAGYSEYGGEQVRHQSVYFEMSPDGKNLFLKGSISYSKADTLDAISRAVGNSSSDPILHSFKLESGAPKGHYKINVNGFLLSENSFSLDQSTRAQMGLAAPIGGGASYVESVHSYPINTEVRTVRTYASNSSRLPSSAISNAVTIGLNTSFVLLPKEPMRARLFDPRVGFFTDDYNVFADNQQKMENKTFITRWRLEPKPGDEEKMKRGELVEPKKQIVYYIDPATPKQWRPYLIAGVNDWNKAFEQAGFKNAIVGKEWPDSCKDMSLEDARFAVIRYLASPIANAYGPQIHDPRSGEIIESHIGWYHNVMTLVHHWYLIQASNIDPRARKAKFDDELMGQLIRFVSSHEVGHTLGLRHNFGASSRVPVEKLRDKNWVAAHGHTPSIMDYARFNYVAQPEDSMTENEIFPRINDYDKWAIQWGYKPNFEATDSESDRFLLSKITTDSLANNPRLWWGDGEGYRKDPRRQTEDLGDDAVKASEYGIRNLKAELPHIREWSYWGNDMNEENLKDLYGEFLGQFNRYCSHVIKYLSGTYQQYKSPDENGTIFSETPRDKEKSVLPFLDKHIFNAPTWLINVPYIDRITNNKFGVIEQIGRYVVNRLTNDNLLQNLNSNYPVEEYLPELTRMLCSEIYSAKPVDRYRRSLQREFINQLTRDFNSYKNNDPSDQVAVVLCTLKEIQKKAKAASSSVSDYISKAHYAQIADQIERALSLSGSSQGGTSLRLVLN